MSHSRGATGEGTTKPQVSPRRFFGNLPGRGRASASSLPSSPRALSLSLSLLVDSLRQGARRAIAFGLPSCGSRFINDASSSTRQPVAIPRHQTRAGRIPGLSPWASNEGRSLDPARTHPAPPHRPTPVTPRRVRGCRVACAAGCPHAAARLGLCVQCGDRGRVGSSGPLDGAWRWQVRVDCGAVVVDRARAREVSDRHRGERCRQCESEWCVCDARDGEIL